MVYSIWIWSSMVSIWSSWISIWDIGDDTIDMVILDTDVGYLVTVLVDTARDVIHRVLIPRMVNSISSHDVACKTWQALPLSALYSSWSWHRSKNVPAMAAVHHGLTLVHFSAQPKPCLTQKHTIHTPKHPLTPPKQPLNSPPIPQ